MKQLPSGTEQVSCAFFCGLHLDRLAGLRICTQYQTRSAGSGEYSERDPIQLSPRAPVVSRVLCRTASDMMSISWRDSFLFAGLVECVYTVS